MSGEERRPLSTLGLNLDSAVMKAFEQKRETVKSIWLYSPWFRAVIVLLSLVPIFILYYSIVLRLPVVPKITEEINQVQVLFEEVEKTRGQWSRQREDDLRNEFESLRTRIPSNLQELALLVGKIKDDFESKGFLMQYRVGKLVKEYEGRMGYSTQSVFIELAPDMRKAKKGEPPVNAVDFLLALQKIKENYFGLEIIEIQITGAGSGFSKIKLNLDVWVSFDS